MNIKIKINFSTKIIIQINTKVHSTYTIRHGTNKDKYACRIIVDFQNVFVTVDYHILLKRRECYGVQAVLHGMVCMI